MNDLTLEEAGDKTFDKCDYCGSRTRKVWGYVSSESLGAHAVYYVRWSDGNRDHGMSFIISIHGWGEGADQSLRRLVAIECRFGDNGPELMAIDGPDDQWGDLSRFGKVVGRATFLASPLRREIFDVTDLIFLKDRRVRGFVDPRSPIQRLLSRKTQAS